MKEALLSKESFFTRKAEKRMKRKNGTTTRNKQIRRKRIFLFFGILLVGILIGLSVGFFIGKRTSDIGSQKMKEEITKTDGRETETNIGAETEDVSTMIRETTVEEESQESQESQRERSDQERINWDDDWKFASFSKIHDDSVVLYHSNAENRRDIVVAVNAGHGTPGGNSVRTMCHPDGSPKVTGGSTAAGEKYAAAISSGMTFLDGTDEAEATLSLSFILKDKLLAEGFDVLMIRETSNCQIDNIARTVYANENADCHISIHYDSSESDKGFFYISVPDVESYRSMEPVSSHWTEHMNLGDAILSGVKEEELKIFGDGTMEIDLTQTSYSTIPSVDIEVGDKASDISQKTQTKVADGITKGIEEYFR